VLGEDAGGGEMMLSRMAVAALLALDVKVVLTPPCIFH
jgi:hypothetical protein